VLEAVYQSLPFGDGYTPSGPAEDPTGNHFTGKERDSESGNDYMFARYYNSAIGRFLSPDPSSLNYANLANPQSLNLYGYVYDNPISSIDPTGLAGCQLEGVDVASCNGISNSEGAVKCPANLCGEVAVGTYGHAHLYEFTAGAGGAEGFVSHADPTKAFNELDGQFADDAEYDAAYQQEVQTYISGMVGTLGAAVGAALDPSGCKGLSGGNLNCTISPAVRDNYVQSHHDCLTGGGEYRCSGPGYSLHFHAPTTPDQLTFHMDSANPGFFPWPVKFPGVLEHFTIDVLGGNTIFKTGVPH
jgi:RHS repeat-associated protein